jgi:hypothetical protein
MSLVSRKASRWMRLGRGAFYLPLAELQFIKQRIGHLSLRLDSATPEHLLMFGVYTELVGRDRFAIIDIYKIMMKSIIFASAQRDFNLAIEEQKKVWVEPACKLYNDHKEQLLSDKSLVEYDKEFAFLSGNEPLFKRLEEYNE